MPYYAYAVDCPDSDLHGVPFGFDAPSKEEADVRADRRIKSMFSWDTRGSGRVKTVYQGEWKNLREWEKWWEDPDRE